MEQNQKTAKEAMTEERVKVVAEKILQGWTRRRIIEFAKEEWDIGYTRTDKLRKAAYEYIAENCKLERDVVREVNHVRLTKLYEKALQDGNAALAIRIIDTLNRMYAVYVEKKEVELTADNFTFKFS